MNQLRNQPHLPMSRRRFLRNTSVTAAGTAVWAQTTGGRAHAGPNDAINVAIVGIRSRGAEHYQYFQRIPGVRIAYVVDVDERMFGRHLEDLKATHGGNPKTETDFQRVLDDKDLDVVSIATPDHWHALQTIWACQAGKDVYCEKPVCHNIWEGRKAVEAARRYSRVVATGTQSRSDLVARKAVEFMRDGGLGRLYAAKALCYKAREPIGRGRETESPKGLHYDLWLGPAEWRPYNENRLHYRWHWFWDYGDSDMGNQGIHQMDVMRWGMGKREHPRVIHGVGGLYEDGDSEQETPNTQYTTFEYPDGTILHFEVRGWYTGSEEGVQIGNFFWGTKGWGVLHGSEFRTFMGRDNRPGFGVNWTQLDYRGAEEAADRPFVAEPWVREDSVQRHFQNFIDVVRSRRTHDLRSDLYEGFLSSAMCHLGNISYRLGRTVVFDHHSERFVSDDQANGLLTRRYRPPYVVPEDV
jgi:predicted dehydrogenase